jgi:uncharacterized membrane protein
LDNFAIVIFPEGTGVDDAERELRDMDSNDEIDLYELAAIRSDPHGRKAAVAAHGLPGAATYGLAGGLLGLLGGPVGLAVGAVGGAWIGTLRDLSELGTETDFADRVRRELSSGKAALVAELDEKAPEVLDRRMKKLGGIVVRGSAEDPEEGDLEQRAAMLRADLEVPPGDDGAVSAPQARIQALREQVNDALARLEQRTAERIARLKQDAGSAEDEARKRIEQRLAATRERASRREASLRRALQLLDAAG